jgi:hypothetical protein
MTVAHVVTSVTGPHAHRLAMTADHAVTSATDLHVHPSVAMTADHVVMPVIGHHVRTLVTDLHVQALEIAQRDHPLATDRQGQASVIVQGLALVTDHLAQAAELVVVAASASSVGPDQAAAAHVDQRNSVLSANKKHPADYVSAGCFSFWWHQSCM